MLRSKFVKFLLSILKRQVHSSPNFVSLFNLMKDNSSDLFTSNNIYFAKNEPIKMKIFKTFKCLGQYSSNSSCQLWNNKSIPPQILRHSSVLWQITPLWILSSYFFNFGLKDPIKIPILRLSSALVKFAIFQTTSHLKVMLDKSVNNVLGEGM